MLIIGSKGFHDLSGQPGPRRGNHPPDPRPHISVLPIGNNSRPLPYTLHIYDDGTHNQQSQVAQIAAPQISGRIAPPKPKKKKKKKKKSGCVIM